MKRQRKLTEATTFRIRLALRRDYYRSMQCLDFTGPAAEHAGFYIREAGEAWDAYKELAGTSMMVPE